MPRVIPSVVAVVVETCRRVVIVVIVIVIERAIIHILIQFLAPILNPGQT